MSMTLKRFALTLLSALCCLTASAIPGIGEEAAALYRDGRFAEAADAYSAIIEKQGTSAELLFNLGNAALQADRFGVAMVAYQRAVALAPTSKPIQNNIDYLAVKVADRNRALLGSRVGDVAPSPPSTLQRLSASIARAASADTYAWLALAGFLLTLGGIIVYMFCREENLRKAGFFGSIAALAVTLLLNIAMVTARSHWQRRDVCVLTVREATPLPQPDASAKSSNPTLTAGTMLNILEPDPSEPAPPGWVRVGLNSQLVGWLPENNIERL